MAQKVSPVTVCIAARSFGSLVGVSDRMLTSGDIQFEPSTTPKIMGVSNSIAVMQSGDAAFNGEIMSEVAHIIENRIEKNRSEWWLVKDVADLYVEHRNYAKRKRAEAALLSPLGLTLDNYRDELLKFGDSNAQQIMRDIINFDVPYTAVIVTGIDPTGAHIYVIDDGNINCNDVIGFAAIGIGARHAESQFMLAKHSPSVPIVDTALLAYIAKRRSEVAPGVGEATDMFTAGPGLGTLSVLPEATVAAFEKIYLNIREKEEQIRDAARQEANDFVAKASAEAAERAEGQQQSAVEGDLAPAERPEINAEQSRTGKTS